MLFELLRLYGAEDVEASRPRGKLNCKSFLFISPARGSFEARRPRERARAQSQVQLARVSVLASRVGLSMIIQPQLHIDLSIFKAWLKDSHPAPLRAPHRLLESGRAQTLGSHRQTPVAFLGRPQTIAVASTSRKAKVWQPTSTDTPLGQ